MFLKRKVLLKFSEILKKKKNHTIEIIGVVFNYLFLAEFFISCLQISSDSSCWMPFYMMSFYHMN